jgi:hypothetical protein
MPNSAQKAHGVSDTRVGMNERWQKASRQAENARSEQGEAMHSIFHISIISSHVRQPGDFLAA